VQFSKAKDTDQLKSAIENYQGLLRNQANPKNLKKFVEAFLRYVAHAQLSAVALSVADGTKVRRKV